MCTQTNKQKLPHVRSFPRIQLLQTNKHTNEHRVWGMKQAKAHETPSLSSFHSSTFILYYIISPFFVPNSLRLRWDPNHTCVSLIHRKFILSYYLFNYYTRIHPSAVTAIYLQKRNTSRCVVEDMQIWHSIWWRGFVRGVIRKAGPQGYWEPVYYMY